MTREKDEEIQDIHKKYIKEVSKRFYLNIKKGRDSIKVWYNKQDKCHHWKVTLSDDTTISGTGWDYHQKLPPLSTVEDEVWINYNRKSVLLDIL